MGQAVSHSVPHPQIVERGTRPRSCTRYTSSWWLGGVGGYGIVWNSSQRETWSGTLGGHMTGSVPFQPSVSAVC